MKYEVMVTYGAQEFKFITVEDVKDIKATENYFMFFGHDGGIALSVPREKLVFCQQVN